MTKLFDDLKNEVNTIKNDKDVKKIMSTLAKETNKIKDKQNLYLAALVLIPIICLCMPILTMYLVILLTTIVAVLHIKYKDLNREFGPGSKTFELLPRVIGWYVWYPFLVLITKPVKVLNIVPREVGNFISFLIVFSFKAASFVFKITENLFDLIFNLLGIFESFLQKLGEILTMYL